MVYQASQNPRTAIQQSSIWHDVPEHTFRQSLVVLEECTNAVPIEPKEFSLHEWPSDGRVKGHVLSLVIEQQLAGDFASIAAVEEGAQSVSAVCIEEHVNSPGLTVRFAAVDSINESLRLAMSEIATLLSNAAISSSQAQEEACADAVFKLIIRHHHRRILGRLRSIKWEKPDYLSRSHKKPLWQDFANLSHRAQFLYSKKESKARLDLESSIDQLASVYESFETIPTDSESSLDHLSTLIKSSYEFCHSPAARTYASRLFALPNATRQISSALKCLHQIEKIAAYYRIPVTLLQTVKTYRTLFTSINLEYLTPYSSVPTTIAYEPWAKTCHVHAEVQLAVYYDIHPNPSTTTLPPRTIGTSKSLCYLCYLFLTAHSAFHIANTHGRLYDQWTIPDLCAYSHNTVTKYRNVVSEMYHEVKRMTGEVEGQLEREKDQGKRRGKKGEALWRVEPMTSRENLLLDGQT